MTFRYEFDSNSTLLHLIVTVPTSVEDFQSVMPEIIQRISHAKNLRILIEVDRIREQKTFQDHDLGYYFINQIKESIARLAIACPQELFQAANELLQLLRNHGASAEVFHSKREARDWLMS